MVNIETYSRNGGEKQTPKKGVLEEVHEIPSIWAANSGQQNYSEWSDALDDLGGWETQVQIDLGPDHREHHERLTPFIDAYHPEHRVPIEHKKKEQMRVRWHLMKIQAAHEREETLDIDVAVLIFPTDQDPSLRRT